jgi:restriction endonuclease S subunit
MESLWITPNQIEFLVNLVPNYYIVEQELLGFMEGLEYQRLGDMADISDGTRKAKFVLDGLPYLRLSNLSPPTINHDKLKFIAKYVAIEPKAKVQSDDILLSKTGVIGKVVLVDSQFDGAIIGPDIIRIRPHQKEDLPMIINYLRSEAGQLALKQHISASITPKLSIKELRNLRIPVNWPMTRDNPCDIDCIEIARCRAGERLKSRLQDYYEITPDRYQDDSPSTEFFTATAEINPLRLDFGYYQIRHTRIFNDYQERSKNEDWIRLQKVADIVRNTLSPFDWEGKVVNYISLASVNTGCLTIASVKNVVYNTVKSRARYIANVGDVILGIVGPAIGEENQAIAFVEKKWAQSLISSSFAVIRGQGLDAYYLLWCLQHPFVRLQLRILARGQWQQMLSLNDLAGVRIPWLNQSKQREIARLVAGYIRTVAATSFIGGG